MKDIHEELQILCQQARSELVLIAPFVKEEVIRRLFNYVDSRVTIVCVTRWRPEEIKAGISDIGVWRAVVEKGKAKLLLLSNLHAKYYRADTSILVGSANLTRSALGWSIAPNVELLVPGNDTDSLLNWESDLLKECSEVDESLACEISRLVELLPTTTPFTTDEPYEESPPNRTEKEIKDIVPTAWLPSLRYPAQLYKVYSGHTEELSTGAKTSAITDLNTFNLARGLDEKAFNAAVGILMLQMPLINRVDRFLNQPRRFGEVKEILESSLRGSTTFDSSRAWQTLMRWLLHFLPGRYKLAVPHHSEIVFRIDNEPSSNSSK